MSDPASTPQVPRISLIPAEMYHALTVAHAEIARLRLTDAEREAVEVAETNHRFMWQNGYGICDSGPDACGEIAATLRGLLERTK